MADVKILTQEEITDGLLSLPGWTYQNDKISREFKFTDFMDSLHFINQLAPYCERLDHHPDTHIFYSKVLFELQRFDVGQNASEAGFAGSPVSGKVTDKDFLLAHKIEELYKAKINTNI